MVEVLKHAAMQAPLVTLCLTFCFVFGICFLVYSYLNNRQRLETLKHPTAGKLLKAIEENANTTKLMVEQTKSERMSPRALLIQHDRKLEG